MSDGQHREPPYFLGIAGKDDRDRPPTPEEMATWPTPVREYVERLQNVIDLVNRGSRMAMPPDLVAALDAVSVNCSPKSPGKAE